jgi:polysaccharide export outer membrane protein
MKAFSLLFLVAAILTVSCTSQRTVTRNYLQNVSDTSGTDPVPVAITFIQKNDLLSIRVYSTAIGSKPEVDAPYNLVEQNATGNVTGFLVDGNGNIEYPQLGILHVEGLTRDQVAELIRGKLQGQLTQPSVIVRFLNYRITVLGEVKGPSTFALPVDRITILEALGLAGDVTEFGRKDNVKVVRESNGQREIGTIDLTSKEMFNSPYFRLQQNDVVFVDQTRRKVKQQEQQTLLQQIAIASSIITAAALILNFVKK